MAGRLAPRQVRTLVRSPLAVSIALFVAILALRFSANAPQRAGILLLLIGPLVVTSLAYRGSIALGMATACLVAYVVAQLIDGPGLDTIGTGTRAFTFYAIPLAVWLARKDARGAQVAAVPSVAEPAPATPTAGPAAKPLTKRESEILGLVAAGYTNVEIAEMLVLSVRTVESHRASLRRKLGCPSRSELVEQARRRGLIGEPVTAPTDGVLAQDPRVPGLVY